MCERVCFLSVNMYADVGVNVSNFVSYDVCVSVCLCVSVCPTFSRSSSVIEITARGGILFTKTWMIPPPRSLSPLKGPSHYKDRDPIVSYKDTIGSLKGRFMGRIYQLLSRS